VRLHLDGCCVAAFGVAFIDPVAVFVLLPENVVLAHDAGAERYQPTMARVIFTSDQMTCQRNADEADYLKQSENAFIYFLSREFLRCESGR
jgi:hypothetical protein